MCQKRIRSIRFKSLDWQKRVKLICKSSGQICPHISQASIGSDSELLTGDSVTLHAILLFNTCMPIYLNKIIHLRASTKDAPEGWLTDLFCLNSKARGSFKHRHLGGADALSGAELIPDLSVIVHG